MKVKVLATGSSGNAYLVETTHDRILVESGITVKRILKGLDFLLPDYCFVSHEHKDHSKSAIQMWEKGVEIICSDGTAKAIGLGKWGHRTWDRTETVKLNMYDVDHDAVEPTMLVVDDLTNGERLVFITDTRSVPVNVDKVSVLMIEANWSKYTMAEDCEYKNRVVETHLSLEKAVEFVKEMDRSNLVEIILIHLSNSNSDEEYFKKEIAKVSGVKVRIARDE